MKALYDDHNQPSCKGIGAGGFMGVNPVLPAKAMERQIGGQHYKGMPLEPLEIAMTNNLNACQFTILKYVLRYNSKGTPYMDLTKAKHTIDMLMELEGIKDE